MNAFETVVQKIFAGNANAITTPELLLAYLQIFHDNPGLHPDGWTEPDSGFGGYKAVVMQLMPEDLPDEFRYPAFVPIKHVIGKWWIADSTNPALNCLMDFLQDMTVDKVMDALDCIDKLRVLAKDNNEDAILQDLGHILGTVVSKL